MMILIVNHLEDNFFLETKEDTLAQNRELHNQLCLMEQVPKDWNSVYEHSAGNAVVFLVFSETQKHLNEKF